MEGQFKRKKRWLTDWWPERLNLKILRQECPKGNPYGADFDYAMEFEKLDLAEVKRDLESLMKSSQDWWPADFGHYGPLFIRMAWHSAGSYRIYDGRGGARRGEMRFPPRINWPDNINLDKAIRLLWPIKQKYGRKLSWADLIILAGNVALESMGVKTIGFGGGREDLWEPDESPDWGPEVEMLTGKERFEEGVLEKPFAATEMGLIYVNPEGPEGNPDPVASAKQIRTAFFRMGMNDEETVALIAGGHAFGKCHGAGPDSLLGPDPSSSDVENQGLGWKYSLGTGKGPHTFTSGFELAWSSTPTKFGISYLKFLFGYEWELTKSPAGKHQWVAKGAPAIIPDAHDPNKKHPPMMLTADLALRFDPIYSEIAKRFLEDPKAFEEAFAKAWFKLIHRDMGPKDCYLGPEVPKDTFIWQESLPKSPFRPLEEKDLQILKESILNSGLTPSQILYATFSCIVTYRDSDRKGGLNGARVRLYPLNTWEVNKPDELRWVIEAMAKIKDNYNREKGADGKGVSISDLLAIGSCAVIENAAQKAGYQVKIPFVSGRVDAEENQIDVLFWEQLEPIACGFRNYIKNPTINKKVKAEELLVDKAQLLTLSVPELVTLYGGLRSLGVTYEKEPFGILSSKAGTLNNEFFKNLLDMSIEWRPLDENKYYYEGLDRKSSSRKWLATRVDLIFSHHEELRSLCEVYAADDGEELFVHNFVKVWTKLIHIDRFDLWREDRSLYKSLVKGI
ncbi:MAG: catalase/peroxidase HPI [Caldimicrobium sp.]|nr:catalase/peroxidase HPI [Caldimicrobium sp.]MCX7613060.1 catalase/peroxidase HPI [Caldimicrobium sp.]MDW8182789.1 catalase/peroxidase HPI [Caldimicrobium sp.]